MRNVTAEEVERGMIEIEANTVRISPTVFYDRKEGSLDLCASNESGSTEIEVGFDHAAAWINAVDGPDRIERAALFGLTLEAEPAGQPIGDGGPAGALTLLDWFAGTAMLAILSDQQHGSPLTSRENIASCSYEIAAEMLAERERRKQ